jgi:hypothetical protein
MDLFFGTHVREHGYDIGRLSGIEADRRNRLVRRVIISTSGTIDTAEKRPLAALPADHFGGDIVLRAAPFADQRFASDEPIVLTSSTQVVRGGHPIGRLSGLEVAPDTGEIVAIVGRQHWWSRRFHLGAAGLDFSVPGKIGADGAASRAA